MNGFSDFNRPVLHPNTSTEESGRMFSIPVSALRQGECSFCSNGQGFIVIEEKLENGQVLTKSEICPVCKNSGRKK